MKKREVHELSESELKKRLFELKLELAKERGQIAIGGSPSNPGKIRKIRKTVARIFTELNKRKKEGE